jgi:hypothetical protein
MNKFNFSVETVNKFHNHGWLVLKDIKPASSFCVDSKEEYDEAVDYVRSVFPSLRLYRRDIDESLIEVHIYKYGHIEVVLDEFFRDGISKNLYHVLSGYIYGIPPHMVEEFLSE